MILATKIQSEKGKEIIKTANEFIFQEFTVKKEPIGQIELYYFDDLNYCKTDIPHDYKMGKCKTCGVLKGEEVNGEWLLKYRRDDDQDWDIIAQGNI